MAYDYLLDYIKDIPEVKFWWNADYYNGIGNALPANGANITDGSNLPVDLITSDAFTDLSSTGNKSKLQKTFRSSPNRIEIVSGLTDITGTEDYGQSSLNYNIPVSYRSNSWTLYFVGKHIVTTGNARFHLLTLNKSLQYVIWKETNTQQLLGSFLTLDVFGGRNTYFSGSSLLTNTLRMGIGALSVYKIVCDGTTAIATHNFVESKTVASGVTAFTITDIAIGKPYLGADPIIPNGVDADAREIIYMTGTDRRKQDQIDSYFHSKYNI